MNNKYNKDNNNNNINNNYNMLNNRRNMNMCVNLLILLVILIDFIRRKEVKNQGVQSTTECQAYTVLLNFSVCLQYVFVFCINFIEFFSSSSGDNAFYFFCLQSQWGGGGSSFVTIHHPPQFKKGSRKVSGHLLQKLVPEPPRPSFKWVLPGATGAGAKPSGPTSPSPC